MKDDRIDMQKYTITKYENILSKEKLEIFKDYNFIERRYIWRYDS